MGVIIGPGGLGGEEGEGTGADEGVFECMEEGLVEAGDFGVGRRAGAALELDGDLGGVALELGFVDEAESGECEGGEGGGLMFGGGEEGSDGGFVVVFEEVGATGDEVVGGVAEVFSDCGGIPLDEVVVERFIVGEVEADFLESGFEVPVGFGEEEEVGVSFSELLDGFGPELAFGWRGGGGEVAPGLEEYLVEEEHCHVAAEAVAMFGDGFQRFGDGLAGIGAAEVELGGIGPGGEVGVFAVGYVDGAAGGFDGEGFRVGLGGLDEAFGVLSDPGVVESGVVGDEVEDELEAVGVEVLSELGEGGESTE